MRQPALNYQGPVAAVSSRGELNDGSRSWIARVERSRYGTATMAILISRPHQKTGLPTMAASPAPSSASPYVALPVSATRSASDLGESVFPIGAYRPSFHSGRGTSERRSPACEPPPMTGSTRQEPSFGTAALPSPHARTGPPGGAGLASPPRASKRRMPGPGRILSSERSRRIPSFRRGRPNCPGCISTPPRPVGLAATFRSGGSRTAGGRASRG